MEIKGKKVYAIIFPSFKAITFRFFTTEILHFLNFLSCVRLFQRLLEMAGNSFENWNIRQRVIKINKTSTIQIIKEGIPEWDKNNNTWTLE